ncbi:MAG: YgjV family protein [Clostridia bacterium]|nr:YgjV family protein [Clostridia bacterium]
MLEFLSDLDWWSLFVQLIGVFAATIGILSYQQKDRKKIILWQVVNNVLWTVHMFLLGAFAGGCLNLIGIFRGTVFYYRVDQKWAQSKLWYAVILALIAAVTAYSITQDGLIALLPMVGMVCTTFSLALANPFHVRVLSFFSSPCWLIYNIINGSIPGICTEIFVMCSIILGILRIDLPKLRQQQKN